MTALKASPFLINAEYLPHFTKLLIEHWDKAKLGLSEDQKKKLLVVRKNTISGIKKIKEQVKFLEFEIADAMLERESVKSVEGQLNALSDLKKEATKIHLRCISYYFYFE